MARSTRLLWCLTSPFTSLVHMHTPFTRQAFPIATFAERRLLRDRETEQNTDQPLSKRSQDLVKSAGEGTNKLDEATNQNAQTTLARTQKRIQEFRARQNQTQQSPDAQQQGAKKTGQEFPPLTKEDRENIEKSAANLPEDIRGMTTDLVSEIRNPEMRRLALGIIILVAIFTKLRASRQTTPQFGTNNPNTNVNTGTNAQPGAPRETPANRVDQQVKLQDASNKSFEAAQKSVEGTPPNRADQALVKVAQDNVQAELKSVNALIGPPALTEDERKTLSDAQRKTLTELPERQKLLQDRVKQLEGFAKLTVAPAPTPSETPQEQLKKQTALTDTALEAARKSMVMPAPAPLFVLPSFDRGMVQGAQKQVDAELALFGRLPASEQLAQKVRIDLLQKALKELSGFSTNMREATAKPTVETVAKDIEAAVKVGLIPEGRTTTLDGRFGGIQCRLNSGAFRVGTRAIIFRVGSDSAPLQAIERTGNQLSLKMQIPSGEHSEVIPLADLAQTIVNLNNGAIVTRNGPPIVTMTPGPVGPV